MLEFAFPSATSSKPVEVVYDFDSMKKDQITVITFRNSVIIVTRNLVSNLIRYSYRNFTTNFVFTLDSDFIQKHKFVCSLVSQLFHCSPSFSDSRVFGLHSQIINVYKRICAQSNLK